MRSRIPLHLGLASLLAFSSISADELLPAPFQIDGIRQDLSGGWHEDPMALLVAVDLGAADGMPLPDRDRLGRLMLIGTDGATEANLVEIEKTCRYLCGDEEEGETCHYVGLARPSGPLEAIGEPLAALPGWFELSGFRSLRGGAARAPFVPSTRAVSRPFEAPVWPAGAEIVTRYRLRPPESEDRELRLEYQWPGGDVYAFESRDCRIRGADGLEELACPDFALILEQERPLLVSLADYNSPSAELIASFAHQDTTYRVVRLGLKAQTVYGLLVETDDGWHALVLPRNHALLC